jgi:hypothetical protein
MVPQAMLWPLLRTLSIEPILNLLLIQDVLFAEAKDNVKHVIAKLDFNRTKPRGWLPPSLVSKAQNILNWVVRFAKLTPLSKFAFETAKFDTQKLENPNIKGVEYQQGKKFLW